MDLETKSNRSAICAVLKFRSARHGSLSNFSPQPELGDFMSDFPVEGAKMLVRKADKLYAKVLIQETIRLRGVLAFFYPFRRLKILSGFLYLGLILLNTDSDKCPLRLRFRSFSVNFRLRKTVRSALQLDRFQCNNIFHNICAF